MVEKLVILECHVLSSGYYLGYQESRICKVYNPIGKVAPSQGKDYEH